MKKKRRELQAELNRLKRENEGWADLTKFVSMFLVICVGLPTCYALLVIAGLHIGEWAIEVEQSLGFNPFIYIALGIVAFVVALPFVIHGYNLIRIARLEKQLIEKDKHHEA